MQTHPDLRWDDLRVFLALYRHGSLKQGARALEVNISTASRRLDALEAATGVHLFDRTPEGVRPTAAAEQLVPFAESMEQAAHGFTRGVEAFEVEPEGEVRITAPPGLVDHFIASTLPKLCDAYPKLQIKVVSSIGYSDLTRREADIALRIVRPAAGDLIAKRLVEAGWAVVAAPVVASRLGRLREPNAARWTTWDLDLAHLPDRKWISANVDPARIALVTNSMTAQIEAVRAGFGLMLAPDAYARLRGLVEVACAPKLRRSIAEIARGSLWLVGHRALRDVPRIAAVWSWLDEQFTSL